jgi:hypothetical protein
MPIAFSILPAVLCTSFKVSGLILRALIHFELTLVQGDRHGSSFSFLQADNHFSQQHVLKGCLLPIVCFWYLCQRLGECSCMDSYLGPLFCSTGPHVYFHSSSMLFLWLWICSMV